MLPVHQSQHVEFPPGVEPGKSVLQTDERPSLTGNIYRNAICFLNDSELPKMVSSERFELSCLSTHGPEPCVYSNSTTRTKYLVSPTRFELVCRCRHRLLKPARIPIPPRRHIEAVSPSVMLGFRPPESGFASLLRMFLLLSRIIGLTFSVIRSVFFLPHRKRTGGVRFSPKREAFIANHLARFEEFQFRRWDLNPRPPYSYGTLPD